MKIKLFKKSYQSLILICLFIVSCQESSTSYLGNDIRIFKSTPIWELAKAVDTEDLDKIELLVLDGIQIDYQEDRFGKSLLMWSVATKHFKSTIKLLELGANPNLQDDYDGTSAMMQVANIYNTSEYVKLFIDNGAEVNVIPESERESRIPTPLIAAADARLESVKYLVTAGADIDYQTNAGKTALRIALIGNKVDIVHYLLLEKGANIDLASTINNDGSISRAVEWLRYWTYELDSDEYRMKMEIVDFFSKHGQDYWSTPVPKQYLDNYSEEYLSKY